MMRFTVEFRPKPPLVKQAIALIEADVAKMNNGLTMANLGSISGYDLNPVRIHSLKQGVLPNVSGFLAGTIVDRNGFVWRAKLQRKTFMSWDGKTGKHYRLNDVVQCWWLNKAEHLDLVMSDKPEQVMPATSIIPMKGLIVQFETGGVWELDELVYDVIPAADLIFYFKIDVGWGGVIET